MQKHMVLLVNVVQGNWKSPSVFAFASVHILGQHESYDILWIDNSALEVWQLIYNMVWMLNVSVYMMAYLLYKWKYDDVFNSQFEANFYAM